MLISSMDQLNYYSMPKDGYLEIDTSSPNGYSMDQQALDDEGSPTYMNEENSPKNGTKSSLYKTELCKRYSEFGSCRYGAKCQFAHGLAELRHVLRHPKYKTTKCKSYWGSGHCPYGSRCRFIHEETESMTQPQFSPQSALGGGGGGAMNGMFFQETSSSQQFSGLSMDAMGGANTGSYLYGGARADDHGLGYQKEYSLLSSFEKDTPSSTPWGMAPRQPSYSSAVGVGVGVGVGGAGPASPTGLAAVGGADGAGFPDLQDAIDTLMRFSLAPTDADAAGGAGVASAPLGTISTTPVDSRITAAGLDASEARPKKDFSLQADELWNDFPSLTTSSSSDFSDKQWPASLSLSLEGTGLFSSSTSSTTATPLNSSTSSVEAKPESTTNGNGGKKDETSPRLSIFERFH